jgi:hypothetical protein
VAVLYRGTLAARDQDNGSTYLLFQRDEKQPVLDLDLDFPVPDQCDRLRRHIAGSAKNLCQQKDNLCSFGNLLHYPPFSDALQFRPMQRLAVPHSCAIRAISASENRAAYCRPFNRKVAVGGNIMQVDITRAW